jgi:hypothetical protein
MPKSPTFARRPADPSALPFECSEPGCDAFPFATQEGLDAHQHTYPGDVIRPSVETFRAAAPASTVPTPTSSGRFATVPNGFGGTTTRKVEAARPANAPTKKQTDYLRSLLAEREGLEPAEVIRHRLNAHRTAGGLTRAVVSTAIDDLLRIKVARTADTARKIEAHGRVTIDKDALPTPARGVLRFAVMSETADLTFLAMKYRSGGEIIVCQEIGGRGDDTYLGRQLPGQAYQGRLANLVAKVIADPVEALLTYGRNQHYCGHCGTKLTNKASRDAGIGPVCATKGM